MIASITGIGWVQPGSMGSGRDHTIIDTENGSLPKLTSKMLFGKTSLRFGRLDNYSKLGLAAIAFALKDADRDVWKEPRPIGMIASTLFGCLDVDMKYLQTVLPQGGALASPSLFAYTLPNVFIGEASIRFGLTGPGFVVNEPDQAGVEGLRMALHTIAMGDCSVMLAGITDSGRPESFPYSRDAIPGALFFVLEKGPAGKTPIYGNLHMNNKGSIFFREKALQDLRALMQMCLNA